MEIKNTAAPARRATTTMPPIKAVLKEILRLLQGDDLIVSIVNPLSKLCFENEKNYYLPMLSKTNGKSQNIFRTPTQGPT
jgi:hypothetical protein